MRIKRKPKTKASSLDYGDLFELTGTVYMRIDHTGFDDHLKDTILVVDVLSGCVRTISKTAELKVVLGVLELL